MAHLLEERVLSLQKECISLPIQEVLTKLAVLFPARVAFSTSFSYEDQVITDLIKKSGSQISFFTIDTGRLFPETYATWSRTLERYGITIRAFYPDKDTLHTFVTKNGPNAFYHDVSLRKNCCHIRKVEPLKVALAEQSVWITGVRAEHSSSRELLSSFEWDDTNQVIKYQPLLHWPLSEVRDYISSYNLPYNPLHDKNFRSIGCQPCSRETSEGEDARAGRWWWESDSDKECGLHQHIPQNKSSV